MPKNRDPPSLSHSIKFSENVTFETWDCVPSNTANLMIRMSQDDNFLQQQLEKWMCKGHGALYSLKQGIIHAGYHMFHLRKERNCSRLVHDAQKVCLPLIVPLFLDCQGTQCTHTIEVYPIRPIDCGPL